MEAAGGGHVEVTQVLLDHGAGVNVPSKDSTKNHHFFFFIVIKILNLF